MDFLETARQKSSMITNALRALRWDPRALRRIVAPGARTRAAVLIGLAGLSLAGCEVYGDQLAEASLFNGPSSKIRSCFGQPDRRIPVGVEQIWVYKIGQLHVRGWLPASDHAERPTFSAPSADCEARFTIDSHGVRGIAYTDTKGAPIPEGETCEIAVRECLSRGS